MVNMPHVHNRSMPNIIGPSAAAMKLQVKHEQNHPFLALQAELAAVLLAAGGPHSARALGQPPGGVPPHSAGPRVGGRTDAESQKLLPLRHTASYHWQYLCLWQPDLALRIAATLQVPSTKLAGIADAESRPLSQTVCVSQQRPAARVVPSAAAAAVQQQWQSLLRHTPAWQPLMMESVEDEVDA